VADPRKQQMADERAAAVEMFEHSLSVMEKALNRLDAAGVPKPNAIDVVSRTWQDCQHFARAQAFGGYGQAPVGPEPGRQDPTLPGQGSRAASSEMSEVRPADKANVLRAIKENAKRLGITRTDLAGLLDADEDGNGNPGASPESGDAEGRNVEQLHGDKTETAAGRTDNTNPGANQDGPGEGRTGAPPKTEPGTGPKDGAKTHAPPNTERGARGAKHPH
jgi:hypothetical protein